MQASVSHEPCFLCGSTAERTEIPWQQGALYKCTNNMCGNYFLSDMARGKIVRDSIDHKPLSDEACRAKGMGQFLCIRLDSSSGGINPQISPQC